MYIYIYIEREEDIEVYRIYRNVREAGLVAKDSQSSEFGDLGRVLIFGPKPLSLVPGSRRRSGVSLLPALYSPPQGSPFVKLL